MHLLNKQCFKAFVNWKEPELRDQNREAVCIVQLENAGSEARPYYAKFYDMALQPKALLNEVLGYSVAKSWGFDVPEYAAVAFLPLKKLKLSSSSSNAFWLKAVAKNRDVYPAFCTSVVNASPPAMTFGLDVDAVRRDIALWSNLPAAVALDHVIANTDRHFGNLLRIAKARYALIDHGRLFSDVSIGWTAKDAKVDGRYRNRLAELMAGTVADLCNQVVQAASDNATFSEEGLNVLPDWMIKLADHRDVAHIRGVVGGRAAHAQTALPIEMGNLC